jgi:hypothetical protein
VSSESIPPNKSGAERSSLSGAGCWASATGAGWVDRDFAGEPFLAGASGPDLSFFFLGDEVLFEGFCFDAGSVFRFSSTDFGLPPSDF